MIEDTLSRRGAQYCCFLALIFASADVWPKLSLGFTFRLSQLFIYLCIPLLLPTLRSAGIRSFPGSMWCLAWLLWTCMTLPFSLFLLRSVGYAFWLASNLLIFFAFTQSFRSSEEAKRLLAWLLWSFLLLATFGILQLLGALVGIDILVSEWWIKGKIPRVNGLSYEPSYYATYLITGWVMSTYYLEKRVRGVSTRLVRATALCTTLALFLCTSRLGWGLMCAWLLFRGAVQFVRFLLGKHTSFRILRRNILISLLFPIFLALLPVVAPDRLEILRDDAIFFLGGIGLFGTSGQSAQDRENGVQQTFNAFLEHPLAGTGLGAVSVEIAAQNHSAVETLEDAKENEGMSIFIELLASVGLVGFAIVLGFSIDLALKCRRVYSAAPAELRTQLRGLSWGIAWILLALQFNQNFLRIYLWMDIAVLVTIVAVHLRSSARSPTRKEIETLGQTLI